jgi:hypothetical protein
MHAKSLDTRREEPGRQKKKKKKKKKKDKLKQGKASGIRFTPVTRFEAMTCIKRLRGITMMTAAAAERLSLFNAAQGDVLSVKTWASGGGDVCANAE